MENNQLNFEVAQNARLTKTNRLDRRTETSKANAEKARLKKLEKLTERRKTIQVQIETDSDSDSDFDSESENERKVIHENKVPKKRGRGRPTKEEEKRNIELINAITDSTVRAIKLQEQERKAVAKAKREAVRKAKVDGTYVNKGRGRPFKPTIEKKPVETTPQKEEPLELVEKKEVAKPESRGAFVFC